MTIQEKYKLFRKAGKELNNKIMKKSLVRDVLMKSARLLGIAHGDTLVFESEDETSVLMDFALYDYPVGSKNTVEIYREEIGWQNEAEKEIFDALLSSYTSLFKIVSILEAENTLYLEDLLNKKDNIKLIDIGFSKTAIPGLLLFIRLIPFKDFCTTSGISFVFPGTLETYLLKRYKKLIKKITSDSVSVKRFVSFFKLNKTDGMEVRYE